MEEMNYQKYKEYLKKEYKNKVMPLKKSTDDMVEFLKNKFDMKEVNPEIAEPIFFNHVKTSAFHSPINEKLKLNIEDFDFIAYEIIENAKSDAYYKEFFDYNVKNSRIIVLVEKKIQYICSTFNRLQLELLIEAGIDSYHYENETPEFFGYLQLLDIFIKKKY